MKITLESFPKSFKVLVKTRLRKLAHRYLLQKRSSKTINLHEYKYQEYLSSSCLSLKQKRLLFQFRVRMVKSVRDNFKNNNANNNMLCSLCNIHYDDQPSILKCPVILQNKKLKPLIEKIDYSDIFKSIEYQIPVIQVLEKVINYRQYKLSIMT